VAVDEHVGAATWLESNLVNCAAILANVGSVCIIFTVDSPAARHAVKADCYV
jgi:hypothetical protein